MGITLARTFVRDQEPTTIAHRVDHIDHVVLTEALIRRGYADDNVTGIPGGNFRRLLEITWG